MIPSQELDVLKIMEKLCLDPERLFDYIAATKFEEHEYNHGLPSSDTFISYQAANDRFIAVGQGVPSPPVALALNADPNEDKPHHANLNKQSLHYAASMD